jgi:2',3'-cyclic-nucleotide 2'-phosphodiesterase (5'-nucleotidase family)
VTSSGELLEEPVRTNGTIIVSGYAKGKMLGVLTLQIDGVVRIAGFTHRWHPLGR